MSTEAQFIFEDGQGGQRDETGAELMEVDQYTSQIKTLTTFGQYLKYQVDHQQASDENSEESNTKRKNKNEEAEKKKKTYTVYSQIDKFNFIHYMIANVPEQLLQLPGCITSILEQVSAGGLSIRKTRTLFSNLNQEDMLKS